MNGVQFKRYEYDPTGVNIDNLVLNEVHTLEELEKRAVPTQYGAFFSKSVKVYNNVTDELLRPNTDYKCVELLQEPTLQLGESICCIILILNPDLEEVRFRYQVLGGHYQDKSGNIKNLYEALITDDRPVNWLNIVDKPEKFHPTLHPHVLDDIYGFGPVVNALERIRQAIILSNVPAFESLIDWVNKELEDIRESITGNVATFYDVDQGLLNNKIMSAESFIYALSKHYERLFWVLKPIKSIINTDEHFFFIDAIPSTPTVEKTVYWKINHITTSDDDFSQTSGRLDYTTDNRRIKIIFNNVDSFLTKKFKVTLHYGSPFTSKIAITHKELRGIDFTSTSAEKMFIGRAKCANLEDATSMFFALNEYNLTQEYHPMVPKYRFNQFPK